MKTLVSIQYLRAFAALAVVVSHTTIAALPGQAGVDVFFVISGFITWTMTNRPTNPARFIWRRFVRVAPLYWIATLVMASHQRAAFESVIKSVLFIPYIGEQGRVWPILVQGWTLNYEMFFYVLIAVILFLPRRHGLAALFVIVCALVMTHPFVAQDNAVLMTYTNPLLLEFLAGVVLAELWSRRMLPSPRVGIALVAIGAGALLLPIVESPFDPWRFLFWGLPSFMIVTGALSLEARGHVAHVTSLKLLGDASYSIYLFHPFLVKSVMTLLDLHPMVVRASGVVIVSAIIGILIFRLLERPMTVRLYQLTT